MQANVLYLTDWRKSIDKMHVISERFLPTYTRLEPNYSRGLDLCWRIIFSDGRIGWGESLAVNSHRTRIYYVPQDIADEPWLVAAAEVGYDTIWAASDEAKYQPILRNIINRASVDRLRRLDAESTL